MSWLISFFKAMFMVIIPLLREHEETKFLGHDKEVQKKINNSIKKRMNK